MTPFGDFLFCVVIFISYKEWKHETKQVEQHQGSSLTDASIVEIIPPADQHINGDENKQQHQNFNFDGVVTNWYS